MCANVPLNSRHSQTGVNISLIRRPDEIVIISGAKIYTFFTGIVQSVPREFPPVIRWYQEKSSKIHMVREIRIPGTTNRVRAAHAGFSLSPSIYWLP